MNATPYPECEGPMFRCTRVAPGDRTCRWRGFPSPSDRCRFDAVAGPHRPEPLNFDGLSFQPFENYASACGSWLSPADFMAMGCRALRVDGAPVVLFAYKHRASRNYLHLDGHGYSAWTKGVNPEPIPPARATEHATGMNHYHSDGCLSGSRVVTLECRRKAG